MSKKNDGRAFDSDNYVQITPNNRCNIKKVVRVLDSKLVRVRADRTIESEWEAFQNLIGRVQSFTVNESTQCSRDVVKELTNLNLDALCSTNVTQGTSLHDQERTNLCVYFSITSAIRHEIKKIVGRRKSTGINIRSNGKMENYKICIPGDKTIDYVLDDKEFEWINRDDNETNFYPNPASFERMLALLLGCVSPRALSARGELLFI